MIFEREEPKKLHKGGRERAVGPQGHILAILSHSQIFVQCLLLFFIFFIVISFHFRLILFNQNQKYNIIK